MRSVVSAFLIAALALSGCGGSLRAAAERFAIGVGRGADDAADVEAAFRSAFRGSTDDEIAEAITRATARNTWMDDLAANVARQQEEQQTVRAVAGATCTLADIAGDVEEAGLDGLTETDVVNIITNHIRAAGLPETEEKVLEIADGIEAQLRSLEQAGSIDWASAFSDLGCFAF